ncbi:MAG: hypothetical protein WC314_22320 [Vulcanimicrobiota bacterium]
MASHQEIDERSLRLAHEVARRIDRDPSLLAKVRAWADRQTAPAMVEWQLILHGSWSAIRATLLDPTDLGKRLRQSSPFVGILTPRERWRIYRESSSA